MSTLTLKHDRRMRIERREAKARAERERERAELTGKVKRDALRLAVDDPSTKSRLKLLDIATGIFDELSAAQRISILEDYIEKMRKLGSQLLEKYGGNGKEAVDEINNIQDLIDEATGMIIGISIKEIHESFIPDEDAATNDPGTSA